MTVLFTVNVHYYFSHYLVVDNNGKGKMPFFLLVVMKHRADVSSSVSSVNLNVHLSLSHYFCFTFRFLKPIVYPDNTFWK